MPYIERQRREQLDSDRNLAIIPENAGELNYIITHTVLDFLGDHPRYADFNAAIGALECAKLELYRRMVAPYEDNKIAENGDVYPAEARPDPMSKPVYQAMRIQAEESADEER